MRRSIVTVIWEGDELARELELPTDVGAAVLAELIVRALAPEGQLRPTALEAHPPGRALHPAETLDAVGAWDGAFLLIRTVPTD